jgi:ribosomal protein S18
VFHQSQNRRGGDDRREKRDSNAIRKKRTCRFCDAKEIYIDYKDEKKLYRFVTEQGNHRIVRKTSTAIGKVD